MRRFIRFLILTVSALFFLVPSVSAKATKMPYEAYNYDWWGEPQPQPAPYLYLETLGSRNKERISLNNPQDLFEKDGKLYIADTDNNRILIVTDEGDYVSEVSEGLSNPKGVFVTADDHIYVADSGNGRIVEFDRDKKFIREIGRPETELIPEGINYIPTKLVVDSEGRIYTTAYGINMGLVEINADGSFQGFMGATKVNVSPLEYIWKNYFSTKAQKQRMETIIPTEYSNLYLDGSDFVYATISNLSNEDHLQKKDALRRLNPTGTDVLRRLGHYTVTGDLYNASDDAAWSEFVDVSATDYGCYFVLDRAGGKVFCYDGDGNCLFIFGGNGSR
ncbi:MAG: NHL repeat-containing protein, partial [Lachnospiraceae bacterium]|nr:NHL repeat-containing protein [Lachnospiraceae bacterium]